MAAEQYHKVYLYKQIVQAKLFIDKYYTERIDLSKISNEAYFSKFHFIRLFKKLYGKTPHQYLMYVRIEKAMIFLKLGRSVTEVCYAVGFESISSFCALFKRNVGSTPVQYQTQQRQLEAQIVQSPLMFIPGCFAEKIGWK